MLYLLRTVKLGGDGVRGKATTGMVGWFAENDEISRTHPDIPGNERHRRMTVEIECLAVAEEHGSTPMADPRMSRGKGHMIRGLNQLTRRSRCVIRGLYQSFTRVTPVRSAQ